MADALHRLADDLGCAAIVDVGAGRGELLTALAARPTSGTTTGARARSRVLWGVDVVPRPSGLPARVGWSPGLSLLPERALAGALVLGWELLDVVPHPVLELDSDLKAREVMVDPTTGRESLGPAATPADRAWVERWWPLQVAEEGDRIEVGRPRDRLWADLAARTAAADGRALLAVDYCHEWSGRPAAGSLTGFRAGRAVPAVPDRSMDLTTHVALDAVAAAVEASVAGVTTQLTKQGPALRDLGVSSGELLKSAGLGGFGWLLQSW